MRKKIWTTVRVLLLAKKKNVRFLQRCVRLHNYSFVLCSKLYLFLSQWDSFTVTQQPIKFQRLFKEISQIAEKWEISFATFQKPAQYTESIKYLTKLK